MPDEIYNLAAQSHVGLSFEMPMYTADVIALGTLRILEIIKRLGLDTKFFHASTCEVFGNTQIEPQNELTSINPANPYACAKAYAHFITNIYRKSYGVFACNGILYSHESPNRSENFVTRKITKSIAKILAGKQKKLYLGNIEAKRDWGHAKDYVEAIWLILQSETPDDYVLATGQSRTIRDFLELAFNLVGLNWQNYVEIDPNFFRPTELRSMVGDTEKIRKNLNWEPKIKFEQLVEEMLEKDLQEEKLSLRNQKVLV